MNAVSQFFAHIAHLFKKEAPKIEQILQPEIDLLNNTMKKFAAVDLTTAATVALTAVAANTPFQPALAAVATALKSTVVSQAIEATDEEVTLVAQNLIKSQATAANTAIAAGQAAAAGAAAGTGTAG